MFKIIAFSPDGLAILLAFAMRAAHYFNIAGIYRKKHLRKFRLKSRAAFFASPFAVYRSIGKYYGFNKNCCKQNVKTGHFSRRGK